MPQNDDMRERDEFFNLLYPSFIKDENIYILYADVGCEGLDKFRNHYRCINVGIAEQNMIAVASGLANEGKRVYCFTIQAFYLRATEQIRNLVKGTIFLVGCGKDKYYGKAGFTHHATEDKAIISQFGIKIWDGGEIKNLVEETSQSKSPIYIRLTS
jgi:transketolase